MTLPRVKRFALFILLPLAIEFLTAVFSTSLPIIGYEIPHSDGFQPHNVIWELIYGSAFPGAAWVSYFLNLDYHSQTVGLVGGLIWPLLLIVILFIASRRILRSSHRSRLIWSAAFLLSLVVYVLGQRAENFLADDCWVPLYWNLYASYY